MESFLEIRHNMEVAHRLFNLKGRCEQIHGHSMWVTVRIYGEVNPDFGAVVNTYGKVMDFGSMKKGLRHYLDNTYDHRLFLNQEDPWAQPLFTKDDSIKMHEAEFLPGLVTCDGDPTTENLALWIGEWAMSHYGVRKLQCTVQETAVNAAGVILGGD